MKPLNGVNGSAQAPDAHDEAERPLRVVIAYSDLTAGFRAMRMVTDLGRGFGDELDFHPIPWSFELLADEDLGKLAADDAFHADILIIAAQCTNPLPAAVGRWAESAIRRKEGTAAAVIALFGPEEHPDGRGSARLQAIQTAARGAGLEFFSPSLHHEPAA